MDIERERRELEELSRHPELFIQPSSKLQNNLKSIVKGLFDFTKQSEKASGHSFGPLPELYVDGFDAEQIWEELKLRADPFLAHAETASRKLAGLSKRELHIVRVGPAASQPASTRTKQLEGERRASSASEASDNEEADDDASQSEDNNGGNSDSDSDSDSDDAAPFGPQGSDGQKARGATAGSFHEEGDSSSSSDNGTAAGARENAAEGINEMEFLDQMDAFADREERKEYGDPEENGAEDVDSDDDGWQDALFSGASALEVSEAEKMKYGDVFGDSKKSNASARANKKKMHTLVSDDEEDEDDTEENEAAPFGSESSDEDDDEGQDADGSDGHRTAPADIDLGAQKAEGAVQDGPASDFHKAQQRLKRQIATLEEAAIAEKAWNLVGEARAGDRPENSLLGLHVDYETASTPVPVITAEVTSTIEDLIKQRIKSEAWDDVVRKVPDDDFTEKDLPEVSQDKSKAGLSELYEADYLKKALGLENDESDSKKKATLELFDKLCDKLNALSNFHFIPKKASAELEVVQSLPSLAMEEVIPLAVSSSDLQAPGDVYKKKKGRAAALQGAAEMSREERASQRRALKAAKRKRKRQKDAEKRLITRLNPGLGNRYSKQELADEISQARNIKQGEQGGRSKYSKSGAFFDKLQATVANDLASDGAASAKRGSKKRTKGSTHKL